MKRRRGTSVTSMATEEIGSDEATPGPNRGTTRAGESVLRQRGLAS